MKQLRSTYAMWSIALITVLYFLSLTAHAQTALQPFGKISPIVAQTIEKMKNDGINPKNAGVMNAQRRYSSPLIRCDEQGRVGVHLQLTEVTPTLIEKLQSLGGDIVMALPYSKMVSVYLPIDMVIEAARFDEVKAILPISGGTTNAGAVVTEGDSIHHAKNVRADLNIKGDSVKVGVISDGCVSWMASAGSGDLPAWFGPANFTFKDNSIPPQNVSKIGVGDEGTAMMEIIHDLAPNADLYFYGALNDPAGSAAHVDAIHRLVTEKGCKVIVDDLTWFDQPMFEDNTPNTLTMVAAAAEWANSVGVVYISSAGNFGGDGSWGHTHYQALFNDVNPLSNISEPLPLPNGPLPTGIQPGLPPLWDDLHFFGADPSQPAGPIGLKVVIPAWISSDPNKLIVILEWNEPWGAAVDEYDLYIYDAQFITRRAWGTRLPIPNPYVAVVDSNRIYGLEDTVNIVINHRDTLNRMLPPKLLGMYIFGCKSAEYFTPQNSIWGQPGVPEVIAVGATNELTPTILEPFSSQGSYDVYFPNPPGLTHRPKPDVVAVDNVAITGAGGFGYWDPATGHFRFLGTSAAAPHVAGMAALMLSQWPNMLPGQIRAKLERTAVDCGTAGLDDLYGNGLADIERAMLELNTAAGQYGPFTNNINGNNPAFFSTNDYYAVNTVSITGGAGQPASVTSNLTVTAGSPYQSAGVTDLGCPTVHRWYDLGQAGGTNGQFNASLTAYVDESERDASGLDSSQLALLHWNGSFFDVFPQSAAPDRVGSTWKLTYTLNNASFSPFFIGHLMRGLQVAALSNNYGNAGTTVPVSFSIKNSGNGWDSLSFHVRDRHSWTISPHDSLLSLTAGQQMSATINVSIPSGATYGVSDTVWLIGRSVTDTTIIDSALATVTLQVLTFSFVDGWNMVSVPAIVGDYCVASLYPKAVSKAFAYDDGYVPMDSLRRCIGFWVKFSDTGTVSFSGSCPAVDTIDLKKGWNMIGAIGHPVNVDSLATIPDNIIVSNFFGYGGAFFVADSLMPGSAYWIKVDQPGKIILSATSSGGGITRRSAGNEYPPLPPGMSEPPVNRLPDRYAIEQNFPNPFNPSTLIRYQLPVAGHVLLSVYNMLGQEVNRLIDENEDAGYKEVRFMAGNLASGVYYYSIRMGTYSQTKKLMLVK